MDHARHYQKLIDRARERPWVRDNYNHETHHVVPRCMGGSEERQNLVRLTREEHCIAHLLLTKIHPESEGLAYAARNMSRVAPSLKLTKNKRYGRGKRAAAKSWERLRGHYFFRASRWKPKRFSLADVDRLKKMLEPKADFS